MHNLIAIMKPPKDWSLKHCLLHIKELSWPNVPLLYFHNQYLQEEKKDNMGQFAHLNRPGFLSIGRDVSFPALVQCFSLLISSEHADDNHKSTSAPGCMAGEPTLTPLLPKDIAPHFIAASLPSSTQMGSQLGL